MCYANPNRPPLNRKDMPTSPQVPCAQAAQGSATTVRVLVLGGTGFLGRHAQAALRQAGAGIVIGTRYPERHAGVYPHAELRTVRFERLLYAGDWRALLRDIDVVVNCVGILWQWRRESYDDVHHPCAGCAGLGLCWRGN